MPLPEWTTRSVLCRAGTVAGCSPSTAARSTCNAVTVVAGTLRIAIGYRDDIMRLTPTVRDEFALGGGVARIERTDGRVTGIRVNVGRVRGIVFARC